MSLRAVLLAVLMLPAARSLAQSEGSAVVVDRWLDRQRSAVGELESISVLTTVRHAVDTSVSTRVAAYAAYLTLILPEELPGPPPPGGPPPMVRRRGAGPGPPPGRSSGVGPDTEVRLLWMTLDGDTLETAYARRVLQRLRDTLRPETTRLLDDIGIPAAHMARLEPSGPPQVDRIAGRPALRIDTAPVGGAGRRLRVSLWFDESAERLVASRVILQFPGDRRLTAWTEYVHIGGVDLPVSRMVDGVVPVPRRGRDISLALDHRTRFSDYEFRFKDG